jgi:hypothetical protein
VIGLPNDWLNDLRCCGFQRYGEAEMRRDIAVGALREAVAGTLPAKSVFDWAVIAVKVKLEEWGEGFRVELVVRRGGAVRLGRR